LILQKNTKPCLARTIGADNDERCSRTNRNA